MNLTNPPNKYDNIPVDREGLITPLEAVGNLSRPSTYKTEITNEKVNNGMNNKNNRFNKPSTTQNRPESAQIITTPSANQIPSILRSMNGGEA